MSKAEEDTIVAEDWRIDGIDRRLDRIEREMRNGDERGERRVVHVEGRINGIYQMLLERTLLQMAGLAVIALIVGVAVSHHH